MVFLFFFNSGCLPGHAGMKALSEDESESLARLPQGLPRKNDEGTDLVICRPSHLKKIAYVLSTELTFPDV